MSDLSVNTNNLQDEGLDAETVDLGTSNLETTPSVNIGTSSMQVGIRGPQGVGVQSIEQTTTSTEDGGINEVTQTLTDGTTAVFQIRNGSRGSQGVQGERGEKGDKGDTGEDWIPTQQELASIASSAAALVDVPTKTSDLQNDSHFATEYFVERKTADMVAAIDDMRGEANGFASLDANGKVPSSQLPSSGGEANVIEIVKVNGNALTPDSNKAVDVLIPSWAMQATKPSYTASEVGALPASTTIPSTLADLSADSTHRVVTDTEKAAWNGKQSALTWDTTPTQGSTNPVTSGGIYNVLGDIETLINAL